MKNSTRSKKVIAEVGLISALAVIGLILRLGHREGEGADLTLGELKQIFFSKVFVKIDPLRNAPSVKFNYLGEAY